MAKTTSPTSKLERTYTIPLRGEILKVPRYKRARKAVSAVKKFLSRHMKSEDIKIGPQLNEELWKHGMKNPPIRVRVTAVREDNVVRAEMEGVQFKSLQTKKKTETATGLKGKLQGMVQPGKNKEDKGEGIEGLAGSDNISKENSKKN